MAPSIFIEITVCAESSKGIEMSMYKHRRFIIFYPAGMKLCINERPECNLMKSGHYLNNITVPFKRTLPFSFVPRTLLIRQNLPVRTSKNKDYLTFHLIASTLF